MRFFLVAAAIAVAVPASADAQRWSGSGVDSSASAGFGAHWRDRSHNDREFERRDARDDRHDRRRRGDVYFYGGYGQRDIDRSWQPDSFNDWWHERPHRSHPAWMSRNENCHACIGRAAAGAAEAASANRHDPDARVTSGGAN